MPQPVPPELPSCLLLPVDADDRTEQGNGLRVGAAERIRCVRGSGDARLANAEPRASLTPGTATGKPGSRQRSREPGNSFDSLRWPKTSMVRTARSDKQQYVNGKPAAMLRTGPHGGRPGKALSSSSSCISFREANAFEQSSRWRGQRSTATP